MQRERDAERLPPNDLDAEQASLGACLLEARACETVADVLQVPDFYREVHRDIYRAILAVRERDEPVDLVTVAADDLAASRQQQADEQGNTRRSSWQTRRRWLLLDWQCTSRTAAGVQW